MVLVDSSGWVEFVTAGPLGPTFRPLLLKPDAVVTPTIVIYEVAKAVSRLDPRLAEETVAHMQRTCVFPLNAAIAIEAARISLERSLPMADAIIYATALAAGVEVATADAHFEGIPGVRLFRKS